MSFVGQSLFKREEIAVPARLPIILKQFCKAAIRTQPYDLLKWSSSYFRALADGEEPPVKSRLEHPTPAASVLTVGFLRVLLRQFGNYNKTLPVETILHRWDCLSLDRKQFDTIVTIGKFRHACQVKKFLSVAVGLLGANLTETMIMICQLFTHEPDGGSAMIPFTLFMEIYEYLVGLGSIGSNSSEKSTIDHDTTECTTCTNSGDGTCSITSQDTDANVNLDTESVLKDEIDSSKIDLSTEPVDNTSSEKESANGEKKDESLFGQKIDGSNDTNCEENTAIGTKFCGTKDANGISEVDKDTKSMCYLNVPGICSGLSAEEVAKMATWMLECAKLQEGMVGPRNIRHTNCPPLHKRSKT
ncbi:ropporin-1-like protein [Pseudomyrmex gracilis]|uniref:ropporin-1-like protein n=1 Tax=Pseudomyrmex gracilis TaxID=219809 RepID=UPI0009952236|nr:ropporin-1-like protein [Pseudomyrmex gracilis]